MNTTTMNPSTTSSSFSTSTHSVGLHESPDRIALIMIYTVVLLVGSVGLILMIFMLKANLRSWTTIAFLNLLLAHFLFLLTIPFRIHYYITNLWSLSQGFCKLVSAMIHLHMYVIFVIYVVILSVRYLQYFKKADRMEFYRRLHALLASAAIWSIVLITGPVILTQYGRSGNHSATQCFKFGDEVRHGAARGFNIFLSVLIIIVSCIMSYIFGVVLYSMVKKHGRAYRDQQEFWAQMKSISLILIIFTCLVPYHLFRVYYVENTEKLQDVNEVFLAITSFTCFDMLLTYAGRGLCHLCGFWQQKILPILGVLPDHYWKKQESKSHHWPRV